jgi:Sugar-transfer associated ATP-grasp
MKASAIINKVKKLRYHMRRAAQHKSLPRQLVDIVMHKIKINVNLSDYYRLEFYKDGKSWEEKGRYVLIGGSRYWPYEGNAFAYTATLSNKYIQKTLLNGFGLPAPRLIATIGKSYQIRNRTQFDSLLDGIDGDVVLKPISSAQGNDIFVLTGNGRPNAGGDWRHARDEIWDRTGQMFDIGWLVEERMENSPDIRAVYPSALNTYRVVTIKTNDNQWHVAACWLKFGRGGSVVDNSSAGGILVAFDAMGRSDHAYDYKELCHVTHHPDTGLPLLGIGFSGYKEAMDLALRACGKFCYMGTVGWDIAHTTSGCCIIEGNTLWGPEKIQLVTGRGLITDEIAKGLTRHGMLSRWDKSRMYPGYDK